MVADSVLGSVSKPSGKSPASGSGVAPFVSVSRCRSWLRSEPVRLSRGIDDPIGDVCPTGIHITPQSRPQPCGLSKDQDGAHVRERLVVGRTLAFGDAHRARIS